jgi:hypothetical protein
LLSFTFALCFHYSIFKGRDCGLYIFTQLAQFFHMKCRIKSLVKWLGCQENYIIIPPLLLTSHRILDLSIPQGLSFSSIKWMSWANWSWRSISTVKCYCMIAIASYCPHSIAPLGMYEMCFYPSIFRFHLLLISYILQSLNSEVYFFSEYCKTLLINTNSDKWILLCMLIHSRDVALHIRIFWVFHQSQIVLGVQVK